MDVEAANRDPRDQITYEKKEWACPCGGCKKARKQTLEEVYELLSQKDIMWAWFKTCEYVKKELNKK